jgi:hypothetical protein
MNFSKAWTSTNVLNEFVFTESDALLQLVVQVDVIDEVLGTCVHIIMLLIPAVILQSFSASKECLFF